MRAAFPGRPAFDTAVSRALLERVARGELPETFRLARPGAMVAFGKLDAASPGYPDAVRRARAAGFEAVERLAGGRAAVFHEGTLAIAHARRERDPRGGVQRRFEETAGVIAAALRRFGVDARVGEVAGEYCPGDFSVNARGAAKLAGIGQRLIRGATHLGGVVVARDTQRVRAALVPVYDALGLDWDPATAGSVEDELAGAGPAGVASDWLARAEEAIVAELAARHELVEAGLDEPTLALAAELEPRHSPPEPIR